jgi:hypothetical protein
MSYLTDKHPCSCCGDLYDLDMLNWDNVCRDCMMDEDMLNEIIQDEMGDES